MSNTDGLAPGPITGYGPTTAETPRGCICTMASGRFPVFDRNCPVHGDAVRADETPRDPLRTELRTVTPREVLYACFDDEDFMASHLNARSLTDAVCNRLADAGYIVLIRREEAAALATPAPTADEDSDASPEAIRFGREHPWPDEDAAWEALSNDLWHSVPDVIARHRPLITAAIRRAAPPDALDVDAMKRIVAAVRGTTQHTDDDYRRGFDRAVDLMAAAILAARGQQ